ncbi:MAG: M24 family metallopeptidase [Trueperaceae bacterium]
MTSELEQKLSRLRLMMAANNYDAVHIMQRGNLAWLLCGMDVAISPLENARVEAIITKKIVTVITPMIEAGSLERETLPKGIELIPTLWYDNTAKEKLLNEILQGKALVDTKKRNFNYKDFWPLRVPLTIEEIERYRALAKETTETLTDVLQTVKPGITARQLKGSLAESLYVKGLRSVKILVVADEQLEAYPAFAATCEVIQKRFRIELYVRQYGLMTSLTRSVNFGKETAEQKKKYTKLLEVEKTLFDYTRHGIMVGELFRELQSSYKKAGRDSAWREHHQGGPIGYNLRDFLITPESTHMIVDGSAYAWNPVLPGLKVEDTVLLLNDDLELLTHDPRWPLRDIVGRLRPEILEL